MSWRMSQSHRGLSGVVTVIILILLALVAIGLVWAVVFNMVKSSAEQISVDT